MKNFYKGVVSDEDKVLPIESSLLRGDGVFETLLSIDEKAVAWDRHYSRMQKAANKILINVPAKIDLDLAISAILKDEIGRNRLRIVCLADGGWFLTLQPVTEIAESLSLTRFPYVKDSKSVLSGIKSLSYSDSITALRFAENLGFDDSIFLNERDEIVETGLANLLLLTKDGWRTPAISSGCLPGITRELLMIWFGVKESSLTYEDLLSATAVYLTSSIRLIQRVDKVEQKLFAPCAEGAELIDAFETKLLGNLNP
jgi:branched-subunit amino acid aminotransferase/4-amino-4-deoxychorismate lyase